MFVQIIEGKTSNSSGLRQRLEQWQKELMPSAIGFLGSTSGVTPDGKFFNVARFESAAKAKQNSGKPEQDKWWRETEKLLDGKATFRESEDVETWMSGGSDTAGFVQVIQGTAKDREALTASDKEMGERLSEIRPDIIGGIRIWESGNKFTDVVYFTSEAEARKGEQQPMTPEAKAGYDGWQNNIAGISYLDLKEPQFISP